MRTVLAPLHHDVFERSRELSRWGAALILWPEWAVRVLEEDEPAFIERGKTVARAGNVYLLMAYFVLPLKNPAQSGENKAVLINSRGGVEWHYIKTHPVPGSSDKPGDGVIPVTDTPFSRLGAAICYDMDFSAFVHQAGRAGVDIMLVPAWDWREIDPLHTHMAAFRAVENGFSMVRQTGEGLSISVDYLGRTTAAVDHFTTDDHVMIAHVSPKGHHPPLRPHQRPLCLAKHRRPPPDPGIPPCND